MINFEEIRDIMETARKKHFTDKGLETKPGIFYLNGNDGTDFDYKVNGRVCEFYIVKNNKDEDGLIKLLVEAKGTYTMYVYDFDDPYGMTKEDYYQEFRGNVNIDVYDLACHLQANYDDKGIYDAEVKTWVLEDSTDIDSYEEDDDDEDDYWDYDDDDWDDDED